MFYTCWGSAGKTDGPHRRDRKTWTLEGMEGGEKTRRRSSSSSSIDKLCIPSFCSSCVCRNLSPRGQTASVDVPKKLCLVPSDVCYGARATIVAPSAYAPGLYIDARKGYCLLLAQHCVRQTKRTCIKGLDSSSLFMWK